MSKYVSKFDGCVYELTQSMVMEDGELRTEDKTLIWRDAPCGLDKAWENNIPPTEFVGFYYGEPNEEDTEYYIREYWKKKVVEKPIEVVEKKPDVVTELPICFVNMIAACLTTIQEHDLLDLVYGKFASVDEKETSRDDLETVLREFCDVLQELDEDTVIVKK